MNTSMNPVQASDKLQSLFERDERLIDVIASHSPQLAKLRHSPMRRIMARVTTVAQAARVCKMNVESLVNELNGVLGIRSANISASPVAATSDDSTPLPPFTSVVELDVRDELEKGGEPFSRIMAAVAGLGDDAVLYLRAPFEPVPLFGVMEKRGFGHKAEQHADDDWSVWFFRKKEATEATAPATQPATATAPVAPRIVMTDSAADNRVTERTEVWLDVRDLEPPEPLVRTLEALETLPVDSMLVQVNQRVPQFLLPILRERGFHFIIDEPETGEVQVRIWRNA